MHRRDLFKYVLAAGAVAPLLSPASVFAASEEDAILATVNPELRTFAKTILEFTSKAPPLSMATLAKQRQGMSAFLPKPRPEVPVERRSVPGGNGAPDVEIYVVNMKAGTGRPCIVYIHGGGFVSGSAKDSIRASQDLATALDCVVIAVEYRLAPETTYSGSIEDNYAALRWTHGNAAALGIDRAKIAIMGESAGGGHAALLAIVARDRGEVPVCFQCLVYPMLDDRTGTSRAVPWHQGKIIWNPQSNRFGWESFLGGKAGVAQVPAGAVPARVADLAGLPPAWIGVGSIDLFVDEDVDYAQRLNAAGVPAELIVVPGAFHGFDNPMVPAKISQWFNAAKLDALRRGFGLPVA